MALIARDRAQGCPDDVALRGDRGYADIGEAVRAPYWEGARTIG
jgi:hypothetical protein